MSNFKISFIFDSENESVSKIQVEKVGATEAKRKRSTSNTNSTIRLNGASLVLTEDVLDILNVNVESKVVLTVKDGQAFLTNPKLNPKAKGGNKITGKLSVACRGSIKDDLESLGDTFGYKAIANGIIELVPISETQDLVQITEEVDSVLSEEDIESLQLGEEVDVDDYTDLNNV